MAINNGIGVNFVVMERLLLFSTSTELLRIPSDAVVYISADGNYSIVHLADGGDFVLTLQLGMVEKRLAEILKQDDDRFIRIGKSVIVNKDYIAFLNPGRQKMVLSDCRSFRHEVTASKEALKALKEYLQL